MVLRQELETMRQEYASLSSQVEAEDARQRREMESLVAQLEAQRKTAADYQKKIKKLEKLNLQYQQNMDAAQLTRLQEKRRALLVGGSSFTPADGQLIGNSETVGYLRRFKDSAVPASSTSCGGGSRHGTPSKKREKESIG